MKHLFETFKNSILVLLVAFASVTAAMAEITVPDNDTLVRMITAGESFEESEFEAVTAALSETTLSESEFSELKSGFTHFRLAFLANRYYRLLAEVVEMEKLKIFQADVIATQLAFYRSRATSVLQPISADVYNTIVEKIHQNVAANTDNTNTVIGKRVETALQACLDFVELAHTMPRGSLSGIYQQIENSIAFKRFNLHKTQIMSAIGHLDAANDVTNCSAQLQYSEKTGASSFLLDAMTSRR